MGLFNVSRLWGGKSGVEKKDRSIPDSEKAMLLDRIRQSELFKDLPVENLESMFSRMESVAMQAGDTVIREGDEGDYYYLLVSGKAQVLRRPAPDKEPQPVAELTEPKGFGEEALISNAKRNATIVMTEDGVVMRLSKDVFNDFIKDPMLDWFSPLDAQKKIAEGARWLDARPTAQSKTSHLHNAVAIPIEELRERIGTLDAKTQYICYCENGRISSSAAFILRQKGIRAGVLRGGLQSLKRAGLT